MLVKIASGGKLAYFITNKSPDGDYRLNVTDGTSAGTAELCPLGFYNSSVDDGRPALAALGDRAFFMRNNAGLLQLWQSDGTPAGTAPIMGMGDPYNDANAPGHLIAVGKQVFFTRGAGLLYRSDGTVPGTFLIKDFYAEYGVTNGAVGYSFSRNFCDRDGQLYFTVGDPMDPQIAVWRSDGTPGGTCRVWQPGKRYDITDLWNTPDGLYLATSTESRTTACELWRINPDTGAAQRVFSTDKMERQVLGLVWLNGQAYFSVLETQQLWKTTGGAQAVVVAEIPGPSGLTYKPTLGRLAATSGALVFMTATAGIELWTSDGTAGGTHLLKEFTPGPQSSEVSFVPFADGDLFVGVKGDSFSVFPLWKTDGTEAGTVQALELPCMPSSTSVCEFGGGYLLQYSTPETGYELGFLYERSLAITQQPSSPGVTEVNSAIRLTVGVSEWARPLAQYQWMLNGFPIDGATAPDLVISSVQFASAGLYTCRVVVDDGGDNTILVSNAARLTVVEKLPALNAPLRGVLSLLLCFAGGVAMVRTPARRKEHAAR
jgi:ELWxxDGT repeat protein